MRFSKAFIPTTKEVPNDAVLTSHQLLLRAGFIAQVSSGLYNYMPLAKKSIKKIEAVVNTEMASIDAQEVELSFVTPLDLWKESGRSEKFGKELLRFKDRKENDYVLGPTHEEMMVDLVRNRVTSYKQLPLNLYQIKTKFRDEARPRFGLMRGREFIMKDGYSFHSSTEDLDREFDAVEAAYKRVLDTLELQYRIVDADSGAIGGSGSKELMVLADSGEDTIAMCDSCQYAANIEAAVRGKVEAPSDVPEASFHKFKTPAITSIEALSDFFKIDAYFTIKCVAKKAIFEDKNKIVTYFIRGSDNLSEAKAINAIGAIDLEDISEAELDTAGLKAGFIGPLDLSCDLIVIDNDLREATNMVCGANEADYHFVGVDTAVLNAMDFYDLVEVKEQDNCPHCSGKLRFTKGIEVGHIFKLGTKYSEALQANYLDENGKSQPFIMGTYGMGVSRLLSAIVEQYHDENGCIWPMSVSPFTLNIMVSNIKDDAQIQLGETLYEACKAEGIDVILDDRKERFGFKMKDAELIGFRYTLIIGKELANGNVQLLDRKSGEKETISVDNAFLHVKELF